MLSARQRGHWHAAQRKLKSLGHCDPESFALAKPAKGKKKRPDYDTIERIVLEVIDLVRAELATRSVHVGHTVLELAVFSALKDESTEPVDEIVQSVLSQGLHEPGFLIYPLFGFGLLHDRNRTFLNLPPNAEVIDRVSGIAVTSCLGDAAGFLAFLERAVTGLGVIGRLPASHISHFLSMKGVTDWLLRNPILIVRVRSISMGARENQGSYLRSIAHRATLLGLVSALAEPRPGSRLLAGSTQAVNNQETLNIRHYFVFESAGAADQELRADRVPIGPSRAAMLQFSDLNIDVDPAAWSSPSLKNRIGALTDAVLDLEDLQASVSGKTSLVLRKKNLSEKLSISLHWARRSFASFADPREAVIALAVAFEALLSDGYSKGITETIVARARICVKAQRGSPKLAEAVETLFEWRGGIVHKGEGPTGADLRQARRAFALSFVEVVKRVNAATPRKTLEVATIFER